MMLIDYPVQQPVLGFHRQAGNNQRSGLRDLVPLPSCHDSRHLDAIADGVEVGQLGLGDLHGLRHTVPDASWKIFTGFPALGVGLRETLGLLRQEGIGLDPLAVCLDHCRQLPGLVHGWQHSAKYPLIGLIIGISTAKQTHGGHAAVARDQTVVAFIAVRHHRGRL